MSTGELLPLIILTLMNFPTLASSIVTLGSHVGLRIEYILVFFECTVFALPPVIMVVNPITLSVSHESFWVGMGLEIVERPLECLLAL